MAKSVSEKRTTKKKYKLKNHFGIKTLAAAATGITAPFICMNTGASVALHEVVGHGLLGSRLTHNYAPGKGPQFWIGGFDALGKVEDAHSANEGVQNFFSWIFLDHNQNGVVGTASNGNGATNKLGESMGHDGLSAWISIAGSIPGLVVNTLLVSVGMSIRHKHPNLALMLIIFGFENSVIEGAYAWSAVGMSDAQLRANAQQGHDFANFAVKMSAVTGLSSSLIAISTALFWTGFIPLIALAIYFYQKSKQLDIVPDNLAVYYFCKFQKKDVTEENLLLSAMQKYSDIDEEITERIKNKLLVDPIFIQYLIETFPKKIIKNAKVEILNKWQSLQSPSKLQSLLAYSMAAMLILGMITQILNIFAYTLLPCLIPAVQVLNCILPILGLLSIISAGYETYNDLNCPNEQVPTLAKFISLLKLSITVAIVALVITATFTTGMSHIMIPAVLIGTFLNLGLSFTKINIVQKAFDKSINKGALKINNIDGGSTNLPVFL